MEQALHTLSAVWPYVAGGAGISVVTQILKRVTALEKSSVVRLVFHTVTIIATGISWWLSSGMPAFLLVLHGLGMSGVASAFYPAIKWTDDKLTKVKKALDLVDKDLPAIEQAVSDAEAGVESMSSTAGTSTTTVHVTATPTAAPAAAKPPQANF